MHRIEVLEQSGKARLLAALLLNACFLVFTVLIVRIGFESNDDLALAAYVDGQMAVSTAHVPYLNIVLGALLKGIYDLLGRGAAWHTFGQYALLFVSFTAMGCVFNKRLGILLGSLVSLVLLLFCGADAYAIINYTKTAAVCTVAGMLLLAQSVGERGGRGAPILGVLLCLFGFMLRKMEFLPCFAILGALVLHRLCELPGGSPGEKGKAFLRLAAPFALVLLLAAGLWRIDAAAWSTERWAPYARFDAIRVAYSDYGRPAYDKMPGEYEALGLSETDVKLLYDSNYFDPEVFSGEVLAAVTEARDRVFPAPSAGECLGLFLDKALGVFFLRPPIYGLLLMAMLWLVGGRRAPRDWLALLFGLGVFGLAYLYLIYRGRYGIDRVDLGLLLSVTAVLAWLLDRGRLSGEKTFCTLALVLAIGTSYFAVRGYYRTTDTEDFSGERAAVEQLLADQEHVYLAKLDTVCDRIYSPFEPAAAGYWDRIVLLGGFDCNHPSIMDNLARYGVKNPYRDCIGNDRVYLIEDDIELTLRYLREHYDPQAAAELVEPLSSETGLAVYRILKGGGGT